MTLEQAKRTIDSYPMKISLKNGDRWINHIVPKLPEDRKKFLSDLKDKKCNLEDYENYSTNNSYDTMSSKMFSFGL